MRHHSSFQLTAIGSPQSRVSKKLHRWASLLAGCSLLFVGGLFWLNAGVARAEHVAQNTTPVSAASQLNVLSVNSVAGNDATANGTVRQPFKTITSALRVAGRNTVILLAPGTYSTSTGETFPLRLKAGITIQGNPRTRGQDIIIKGGGVFESATAVRPNVTIVGATHAGLTGITVTNPNEQGYGLWIESSSPVVVDNSFTGNNQNGISVNGNSAPLIRSNYIYENGGAGIAIAGSSRPEVRENVVSNMTLGISISQNAAPKLIGNRISSNKDGVVVEGNAQPVLRNNIITNNERDGLVAIASSRPELGTSSEPGGNTFRGNGRFDISNKAENEIVAAFGNQLSDRTEGRVNLTGEPSVALGNSTSVAPQRIEARNYASLPQQATINNQQPPTAASPSQTATRPATDNPSATSPKQETQIQVLSLTSLGNSQSSASVKPTSSNSQSSAISSSPDKEQETRRNGQTPVPSVSASSFPVPSGLNVPAPDKSPASTSSDVSGNGNQQPTSSETPVATNPQPIPNKFRVPSGLNLPTPVASSNQQPTPNKTPIATNPQPTQETSREITFEISTPPPATENSPKPSNSQVSSPSQTNQPVQKAPASVSALPQLPILNPNPLPGLDENNQTPNALPVPTQNSPSSNTVNMTSPASSPGIEAIDGSKPNSSVSSSSRTLRYRVVVEANNDKQKAAVRSLVPDAFHTVLKGKAVMQVGIYSDRTYAEEMLQMLKSKGLTAIIDRVN